MRSFVRFRTLSLLVLLASISSCQTIPEPRLTYADVTHPFADTAVVVCHTFMDVGCVIRRVDEMDFIGKKWSMKNPPLWVRVLPGHHVLNIIASGQGRTGNADIAIDAQPRHVYMVRIERFDLTMFGGTFRPNVTDLGEKSSYEVQRKEFGKQISGVASFH